MAVERPWISRAGNGVRLSIRVQPRASRTEVAGPHGEDLRIRLSSPPVDGAANRDLVAFLAKRLGRPRSSITIERGERDRRKLIAVDGIDPSAVVDALWPGPA